MMLLELFWSFFQIGLLSIGGGYAALPLIQSQVVELHGWLSMAEFTDLITISQMTPGPIAINSATFVGTRIAGLEGAIVATLGCVLPSIIIVSILMMIYFKFKNIMIMQGILQALRPAVVGLIAAAGVGIVLSAFGVSDYVMENFNYVSLILFSISLFVLRKYKCDAIVMMAVVGLAGGMLYLVL